MAKGLSARLTAIVDALPLRPGMRVLEIGCGLGAAVREVASRIGHGHVLAIDRSAKAVAQARSASGAEIASGRLSLRQVAAEELELLPGEAPYDMRLRSVSARSMVDIRKGDDAPCGASRPL